MMSSLAKKEGTRYGLGGRYHKRKGGERGGGGGGGAFLEGKKEGDAPGVVREVSPFWKGGRSAA